MKSLTLIPFLFAAVLFSGAAQAGEPILEPTFDLPANGHCSSADGSLKFEAFQYQGGVAPFPGMLVGERTLEVDGSEWGHSQFFEPGGESENQENWPLAIEISDGMTLSSEGGPMAGKSVYTMKVTVSHLTADVADKTSFVICEDSWLFAP